MAEEKRSTANLVQRSTANTDDRIVILSDPAGNAATATISVNNFILTLAGQIPARHTAGPANSTTFTGISQGIILFDDNYIYVATANNFLKRVAISSF